MDRIVFTFCVSLIFAQLAFAQDAEPAANDLPEETPEVVLEAGETPPPFVQLEKDAAPVLWNPESVGDFKLVDQAGNPVTPETLKGKPWVANFIFSRCVTHCPLTCKLMMEMNDRLPDVDFRLVTITVDPEHDDVQQMASVAEIWGSKPERWIFATGEPDEVWKLIREGFKVSAWENAGTNRMPGMEFAHDNHLIHVDENGKILGRYHSGVPHEMATLEKVLKGKIETPEEHRPAVIEALAAQKKAVEEFEKQQAADPLAKLPSWARRLPATNAMLNALATLMLITGFTAIKAGMKNLHKKLMLYSFGVSVAFLVAYLTYHYALHHYAGIRGKPFEGTGTIRSVYFTILISHVVLAALVPILAIVTIVKGLKAEKHGNWQSHKRWAKVTFPIWLYVSVTGVIIYWMLYQL